MTQYIIEIRSKIPSKKNERTPFKNKAGKMRFFNPNQAAIDRIALQVPPDVRDLGLLHPDIEVWFTVTDGRSDRDNMWTTISDVLVQLGCLRQDSVASCNGTLTIHPAVRGEIAKTIIKLTDTGIDRWPKA